MSRTRPPKAVRSILYIHWKLRYYPSNNPMNFLATNVTKKLDHNKVSIPDLNIRKGAGANTAKTGAYTGVGVFTIVEVREGKGSEAGWGRLKSGAGWISLDYCQRM